MAGPDGRVSTLNAAGRALLGRADAVGRDYRDVLPLTDPTGVDWWRCASPYRGLATRTGHPERLLELGGHELLVTARYVRERPGGPVVRLVRKARRSWDTSVPATSSARSVSTGRLASWATRRSSRNRSSR